MKKTLLFFFLALFATNGLWAQSEKVRRLQESEQAYKLYERYKQNETLSKEEYNLLNPYLSAFEQGDLTTEATQNRNNGGGTAQTNAVSTAYNFSQTTGTYTPITGGTVLGTGTAVDDNNYAAQPIGFTFNYDGVDYTQLGVNSNGFVWFGATAPATSTYTSISSTTAAGSRIVAALNGDLRGGTSGELRIETIGTAPNRECVVQWTNFQHYRFTPVVGDNYNFQIRLREADGRIEIHYGTFAKDATARAYQVGLRGTANTDFNNRTTTTNWSASTAGTVNTSTMSLTTTVFPASGLTFRFSVPPPIDARPTTATLPAGQLVAGTGYDLTVSINNAGTTAISAGYDISYNVNGGPFITATGVGPALGIGETQTYTFTGAQQFVMPDDGGFPVIRVAVSVPGDGNTGNDTLTINSNRYVFPNETVFREDFNTGFTGNPVTITAPNWLTINADGSTTAPFFMIPPAVGALTAFEGNSIANNFQRANGLDIDDYLITPEITGYSPSTDTDSLIFYTRRNSGFADSIDIRLSPGISAPAGTTAADFTIRVAYIVSPNGPYQRVAFKLNDFLPGGTTNYRIAFRYLHFDGGPSGGSSDIFALDAVSVRRSPIPLTASIGVAFGSEAISNGSATPSLLTGTDFESLPVDNGVRSRTFTISNSGLASLNLTGSPIVEVTGAHASDFTVTATPASSIAAASSTTFTVAFNPTGTGTRTATISIAHDAPNTSTPYTFAVSGVGVAPIAVTPTAYFNGFESDALGTTFGGGLTEVNLVGGIIDWTVVQNGTAPTNTPFAGVRQAQVNTGATFAGETRRLVFPFFSSAGSTNPARLEFAFFKSTLTGADLINVLLSTDGGVTFSTVATVNRTGAANAWEEQSFDLTGTTDNAGFQIAFEAVSSGGGGNRNMFIDNVRVSVPSGPEIGVTGNGNPISSGSTTPSLTNHTDFGTVNTTAARPSPNVYPVPIAEIGPLEKNVPSASAEASHGAIHEESANRMSIKPTETPIANALPGTVVRTFTITNTGVDPLTISGVTITGPDAADFSVTASPAGTVAVSASTTFQITFNPSTDGVKNATVEIANNDADENPYTFAIRGTGITSLPLPYVASLNGTAPGWTTQVVTAVGTTAIFGLIGSGVTLPDGSSGGAARANFFSASSGRVEILRTPFISLSGTTTPVLNFDVAYRSYAGENDRIEVVVSTDGGATWLTGSPVLYNKSRTSTPTLATLANSTASFTPTASSQWRHETVDLSQFAGQTDLLIGFRATSAFGNNAWIANVTIQDVPSLAISNVTANGTFTQLGITITFTDFGGSGGNLYFSRFNTAPSSDASVEYATNTSATTPDGSIFTPNVAAPRWWTITYDGQVLGATINYSVSIDITGIPGVNNPNRLYVLRRSNRFGSWVALSTTRSGSIFTATGLTGFSEFVIGGDDVDNPLPVNLGSFTGRNIPQGVELRWATVSETDNAGFDVRRAELINGVEQEWFTVASYQTTPSLVGQGTTSNAHTYTYTDRGVQVGKTYRYALRSVDLNGTIHDYPQTVSVEVNTLAPRVYTYKLEQNYPNPFNPSTRIVYQVAAAGNVKLEVFDMLGRKVATLVNERKEAGEYPVIFNAQNLSSGVYFYRLQTDKFTQTKKLMLVK
ncbi:MAG: choice-of-anchor D domain-containing protein [Chloroherpetonaceae bacterium]